MDILPYDKTNPKSIEDYAKKLVGLSFFDVLEKNIEDKDLLFEIANYYNNPRGKGSLGNLIEKYYFFYRPNSVSEPDFKEAGTELKVTPYELTKKGKVRAGERLVIMMIPFDREVTDDFYKSHLIEKIQLILFIFYYRDRSIDRVDYLINYVSLFSILSENCTRDLEIIIDDYKKIIHKIQSGRAHELSEGDTMYLGACTKGATAKSSLRSQYYSDFNAKSRAFSLKQSYMTYILNHYILKNVETYESILDNNNIQKDGFEKTITNIIDKYIGKYEQDLFELFDIPKAKNANNLLIMRMLGVKTDNAEEFEKANIKTKTIRVKYKGNPREHMSFPAFKINKLVNEFWEESELYNLFSETKFLFIVFQEDENGAYRLKGSKFWNMPLSDLEGEGRLEWEMYQEKFINGVTLSIKDSGNSLRVSNDLPKSRDTKIFHVRPHTSQTAYEIDGKKYGKGTDVNMDLLPDGNKMTIQSFWLNKDYIKEQIKDLIT